MGQNCVLHCTNRDWSGDLHWRQAQCAQEPGGVRPGAVWDKMVVVHAKTRNNRNVNAASIQMVRPLVAMILDAISKRCGLYGYDVLVRPSGYDKLIRLLTELCSSYRLLNVPAVVLDDFVGLQDFNHSILRLGPSNSCIIRRTQIAEKANKLL
ncbi:hypothetical protein L2E82_10933 [Cichorium intybus]|uniref:Uncharacterized protein n=1 Tax=Cichorium intybus TaxID=13427 RepID=A0ACB9GBF9_CICIN|nr:hypothetical protein L2E82_10933 [Cichorium intybus]